MSKGIIVVDVPQCCFRCDFYREIVDGLSAYCKITMDPDDCECYRIIDDNCESKPDWCPIKKLPEYKSVPDLSSNPTLGDYVDRAGAIWWNACIDKVIGKEEFKAKF